MFDQIKRFFNPSLNREVGQKETINDIYSLISYLNYAQPQYSEYSVYDAVKNGLTKNIWVYRCVNLIAESITSAYWQIKDRGGNVKDNHPLLKLLERPNNDMPPKDVWQTIWKHTELCGNSYLLKLKIGNRTRELWPLYPDKMRPIPSEMDGVMLDGYEFQNSGNLQKYEPSQIIHYKYTDPSNLYTGLPPYKAALRNIDIARQQDDWNYYSLVNRFEPSLLVSLAKDATEEQVQAASKKFKEKYRNKKDAGKPLLMSGIDKVDRLSYTSNEMDYIESKKMIREEICNAFGVPPILVGLAENASLNNVKEYEIVFWRHTLLPKLNGFAETLTWAFRDELQDGEYICFDTSHIPALQRDYKERVTDAVSLSYLNVPLEESNKILDLGLNMDAINKSLLPPTEIPVN